MTGLIVLFALSAAAADDWPEFRGPTAQGHAAGSPPTTWGRDQNVVWRRELPGLGWSTPVIVGGNVYVTTAVPDGDHWSLRAVRLDADTGAVDWNVEVFRRPAADVPKMHPKNSNASPTPVVRDGKVYVHFGHLGTGCLDLAGKVVWANADFGYKPVHGTGGSPVLAAGKLVFSIDGTNKQQVVGLDAATGAVAWTTPRKTSPSRAFSFGTPLVIEVNGKPLLVSQGSDVVMGLDPATGAEAWRVRYPGGYSVVPRPVFGHGLLFVCTGYDRPQLLAVRPDGTADATDTHVAWRLKKDVPNNPSPLLVGDYLYLISDAGVLSCVAAATGEVRWRERVGGAFSASPVFAGGHIYLLDEAGTTTVVKPGSGYDPVAKNKLGEKALASPAVAGDALYLRTEKAVYKIAGK